MRNVCSGSEIRIATRKFLDGCSSGSSANLARPKNPFTKLLILVLAVLLSPKALIVFSATPTTSPGNVDWPAYLGDKARSLYSPLSQINRTNLTQLKVAWAYDTGDKGEYQANNLIIAGVLYTASPTRKVIALDATTGKELWKWDAQS
jgi:quinoprotein glucose dehydrogenase